MKTLENKKIFTEPRMRKALIVGILICLFLPFGGVGNDFYIPIIGWITLGILGGLIHLDFSYILANLSEHGEVFWTLLFMLSLWAGPFLALTNMAILSSGRKKWIWFNRIVIPVFLTVLFVVGIQIYTIGPNLDLGYWGYVFVIFLGEVLEAYLYFKKKGSGA